MSISNVLRVPYASFVLFQIGTSKFHYRTGHDVPAVILIHLDGGPGTDSAFELSITPSAAVAKAAGDTKVTSTSARPSHCTQTSWRRLGNAE
jgi:hypothetical protein